MKEISIEDAKKLIEKEDISIIDARTLEEYRQGHIPGAVLIPLSELVDEVNSLDRNQNYLIYCRSGGRSAMALYILEKNGYKGMNLIEGFEGWKRHNLPTRTDPTKTFRPHKKNT